MAFRQSISNSSGCSLPMHICAGFNPASWGQPNTTRMGLTDNWTNWDLVRGTLELLVPLDSEPESSNQ